ncbi:MAG TPA: arginine--tRNA ligase, partial [Roseiarcus sp.]|nr:arginine--tRNA ligase [Roseiarcus sp.]
MNIFADFEARVASGLAERVAAGALPPGLDLSRFTVEPPRDPAHGDLATNAAMVYAKEAKAAGVSPRALAESLAEGLRKGEDVAAVEVAGPGFLNIRMKPQVFETVLRTALTEGDAYGRGAARGGPVNVEYVSANPTGPMHVGHARGAVFGDALAHLLGFAGHAVTREYYINDAGAQVDVLARSAYLRYREALGEAIGPIPEGLYPGDYLKAVGEALAAEFGDTLRDKPEAQWLAPVRARAIAAMMAMIRDDLAMLGIHHDVFASEAELQRAGKPAEAEAWLRAHYLVYDGVLEAPKGKTVEDWEPVELPLFRSTKFGDDQDRPIHKSDGS